MDENIVFITSTSIPMDLYEPSSSDSEKRLRQCCEKYGSNAYTISDDRFFRFAFDASIRSLIALPETFAEDYEKFISSNKKLFTSLPCSPLEDNCCKYVYLFSSSSPAITAWAMRNYRKTCGSPLIPRILQWYEANKSMASKLSRGNITAYNRLGDLLILENEIAILTAEKRIKGVVNMFNTAQKKLLNAVSFTNAEKGTLLRFNALSMPKKSNFIRKMSSVDDASVIMHHMALLCAEHFQWNKASLIEFIDNAPNIDCDIVVDKGDILLVKVNTYDTVKHLTRATNWCITKNKKYWNQYINGDNAQYILFNFALPEDDDMSIVGFTVQWTGEITAAHSFTNSNLKKPDTPSMLVPFFVDEMSIQGVLARNGITKSDYFKRSTDYPYGWNKESYIEKLNKIANKQYHILFMEEDKLVYETSSVAIREMFLETPERDYVFDDWSICLKTPTQKLIIFVDFSAKEGERQYVFLINSHGISHDNLSSCFDEFMVGKKTKLINKILSRFNCPSNIYRRPKITLDTMRDDLRGYNEAAIHQFMDDLEQSKTNDASLIYTFNEILWESIREHKSLTLLKLVLEKEGVWSYISVKNDIVSTAISQITASLRHLLHCPTAQTAGNNENAKKYLFWLEVLKCVFSAKHDEKYMCSIYSSLTNENKTFYKKAKANELVSLILKYIDESVDFYSGNDEAIYAILILDHLDDMDEVKHVYGAIKDSKPEYAEFIRKNCASIA